MGSSVENYQKAHTHPFNRFTHFVGIPTIAVSLPLFFFHWKIALGLFVFGWAFQFLGHWVEGTPPAFLKNPSSIIIAPIWWVVKLFKGTPLK